MMKSQLCQCLGPTPFLIFRSALLNGHEYRAFTYGRRAKLATLRHTSIIGIAVDRALAVIDSPLRVLESGETAAGRPVDNVCVISGKVTPVTTDLPLNVTEPKAVEVGGQLHVLCETAHLGIYESELIAKEDEDANAASGQPGSSNVTGRPSHSWTHGTKKVLIIRIDFSDMPGPPTNSLDNQTITEDYAVNLFNAVNGVRDYYEQGSFGMTSLQIAPTVGGDSPDVTGVLRMPQTAATYATESDLELLHSDARAAAQAAGFSVDTPDRIGVVFSNLRGISGSQVTYAGWGNIIGKNFWINGNYDFRVVTHEIGHNYGLKHANLWQVSDGNPISEAGVSMEYGDVFDIRGNGYGLASHFSHWNKSILQWIPDTAVTTVALSGVYRVFRFDHQSANLTDTLALKIVRDGTRDYWIGYRRGTSNPNLNNGAYILWGYNDNQQGNLLDMTTPGTDVNDAALAVGATFTDPSAQISIHPVATGGVFPNEYLDVQITVSTNAVNDPLYEVTTLAGLAGSAGNTDGTGSNARFDFPLGVAVDTAANVYVVDRYNSNPTVRKITPAGAVSTLAVGFRSANSIAVDSGTNLYLSETYNYRIRKITPEGTVTTFGSIDETGGAARFAGPTGVATDIAGNVFVADVTTIRKITSAGVVTTIAGLAGNYGSSDGIGTNASFREPNSLAVDNLGNIYVADTRNETIRKITTARMVTTLAGLAGHFGSAD